jgi:hypothetical protein
MYKNLFKRILYRIKYIIYPNLKELIFVDLKTIQYVLILFTINVILFYPGDLYVGFPSLQTQINTLENLLRTISVLISIVFSFIVLSFNIYYKYFGRYAFINFFKDRKIKILFTLFLCTISFDIYSLTYAKEIAIKDNYSNSLYIISIVLSLVTILTVFPVIIFLLKQSQSRANIKSIVHSLDIKWLASSYEHDDENDVNYFQSRSATFYQNDPITILTEIGITSIKEFDNVTLNVILENLFSFYKKSIVLTNDEQVVKTEYLYSEYKKIYTVLLQIATKEKNEIGLRYLINSRFDLEYFTIDNLNSIQLKDYNDEYFGWDFQNDSISYFGRTIQLSEDNICEAIIDNYGDFIKKMIVDVLPKKLDYNYEIDYYYSNGTAIASGLYRTIDSFVENIVNYKKYHLFSKVFAVSSLIDAYTINSNNTKNSKIFLLNLNQNYKKGYFDSYLSNSGIKYLNYSFIPYGTGWINEAVDKTDSLIPFYGLLNSIDDLLNKQLLNYIVINNIKAINFHASAYYMENSMNKKLLQATITKFSYIRNLIKVNDSDYRKEIYIHLKNISEYILMDIERKNIKDTDIIELYKESISNFIHYQTFKDDFKSKGYIMNENII